MIRNFFPTEVTTVVYSVKNIKPKKKDRQFCVLFSIGSVKYRTDPVEGESGNPVFNTESVLQVENPKDSLYFVVTERKEKEFYGQLVIPLHDLDTSRSGHVFQKLLEPHKKCSKPTAEIHFEAWISKVVTSTAVTSDLQLSLGSLNEEKKRKGLKGKLAGLVRSPKLSKKLFINRNNGNMKNSREFNSCMDLQSGSWNSLSTMSNSSLTLNSFKSSEARIIEDEKESEDEKEDRSPQITGVSPNSGPIQGGTRIVIRGDNLGMSRQDVIGLFVCGSNVLASLEYFSSSKVACTTKPWKPGEGTITMETQSGGKSRSVIKFTFDGEVTVNVEGPETTEVRRSESLKDSSRKNENFGTSPSMQRANLGERGFLGSKLGITGFKTSKSMLDLTAQDGQSSAKPLHASNSSQHLLPNTNQKKANGVKQPPIIQIQPMRLPESKFTKNINKWSLGTDPSNYKDLQVELDGYQTINSELRMKAHELEDENKRLKEYIGNLLNKIMVKYPDMLCNDRG